MPKAPCAHSPTDGHTQRTQQPGSGAAPGGGGGTQGPAPAPQHRGTPNPPPPPPPSRPHRVGQPGAPRYRQRTIRAGSGRCGAGRSGPPPPGRPPPCAASVGRGGVSERKNHGKVRQIKTKKVQIRGKNIYIYAVRMGKNGPKREKTRSESGENTVRIGKKIRSG